MTEFNHEMNPDAVLQVKAMPKWNASYDANQAFLAANYEYDQTRQGMHRFAQGATPVTKFLADTMRSKGDSAGADAFNQVMDNPVSSVALSALANSESYKKVAGGDVLKQVRQGLSMSDVYSGGVPIRGGVRGNIAYNQAAMKKTADYQNMLMRQIYTGKDGKFTTRGNSAVTGGFSPEQTMQLSNFMASHGFHGRTADGRTQRMNSAYTSNADKVKMVATVSNAASQTASFTGAKSSAEAVDEMARFLGPEDATDVGIIKRHGQHMGRLKAEASTLGLGRHTNEIYQLHKDSAHRIEAMMDVGDETGESMSSTGMRELSRSMARDATEQAMITSSRTGRSIQSTMKDMNHKAKQRLRSTEFNSLVVARQTMLMNPALQKKYGAALNNAMLHGGPAAQKMIMEKISQAAYGDKKALFNIAYDRRKFSSFMEKSYHNIKEKEANGELPPNTQEKAFDLINAETRAAERHQTGINTQKAHQEQTYRTYKHLAKDAGIKVDKNEIANARVQSVIDTIKKMDISEDEKQARIDEIKALQGEGGTEGMHKVLRMMKHDDFYKKNSERFKSAQRNAVNKLYKDKLDKVDPKKVFTRNWTRKTASKLKDMLSNVKDPEERKRIRKEIEAAESEKDPQKRGKAIANIIRSKDYEIMGGNEKMRKLELNRLNESRSELNDRLEEKDHHVEDENLMVKHVGYAKDRRIQKDLDKNNKALPAIHEETRKMEKDRAKIEQASKDKGSITARALDAIRQGKYGKKSAGYIELDSGDESGDHGATRGGGKNVAPNGTVKLSPGSTIKIIDGHVNKTAKVVS